MKKLFVMLACGVMVMACKGAPGGSSTEKAGALPFIEDDYAGALQQARAKKLPLFVDAWAPWCHSCRFFKSTVLKDPALGKLADHFVWLSVDTEKPTAAAFLARHPIKFWPTLLVIDPTTENAVFTWPGITTREGLERMLADAEHAVAGAHGPLEETLAQADRLHGAGKPGEAAVLYRKVLADAPQDWPSRSRTIESLVVALDTSDNFGGCVETAMQLVPSMPRNASFANAASLGLMCALNAKEGTPGRAESMPVLEKLATEALEVPGVLADDKSGIFELLVEARKEKGDAEGVKTWATKWLAFLDEEVRKAPDAEGRAAFDSHVLSAALALNEPARAVPRLMQSEKELPGDYNAPARLALAYYQMEKLDEANAAAARALLRVYGPRRIRVLETMAKIQMKRGNPAGARQALEDALHVVDLLAPPQRPQGAVDRIQQQLAAIPPA